MAPRVPLRNNICRLIPLLCLLIVACNHQTPNTASPSINVTTSGIEVKNGIYYHNKQPFSGCLFALQPDGKDTLFTGCYTDGKPDGTLIQRSPDGKILEVRVYDKGLKTGTHKGFWENGKPRFQYHFEHDLYEGIQYKYFENGKLYTKKNYKNGQEDGMQQEWNQDGKLIINYQSLHGRQYGNIGKKHCVSLWSDSVYSKPLR
jgi:antitoxin component YwqK of YwqJK toxin-antitoxin module